MVNIAAILLRLCHTRGRVVTWARPRSIAVTRADRAATEAGAAITHRLDKFRREPAVAAMCVHMAFPFELVHDRPE